MVTEDFMKIGYSKKEFIKMTKILPAIYNLTIDTMKNKLDQMMKLGYSKDELIKMTKTFPSIYSYSVEGINQKIEDLISLGYSREEVEQRFKSIFTAFKYGCPPHGGMAPGLDRIIMLIQDQRSEQSRRFLIIFEPCSH